MKFYRVQPVVFKGIPLGLTTAATVGYQVEDPPPAPPSQGGELNGAVFRGEGPEKPRLKSSPPLGGGVRGGGVRVRLFWRWWYQVEDPPPCPPAQGKGEIPELPVFERGRARKQAH